MYDYKYYVYGTNNNLLNLYVLCICCILPHLVYCSMYVYIVTYIYIYTILYLIIKNQSINICGCKVHIYMYEY